jgi:hypothetical protein
MDIYIYIYIVDIEILVMGSINCFLYVDARIVGSMLEVYLQQQIQQYQ